MTFDEWMAVGVLRGWCGPVVCDTHGVVTTQAEDDEFESGGDPCVWVARINPC